jgi:hypothetical protein
MFRTTLVDTAPKKHQKPRPQVLFSCGRFFFVSFNIRRINAESVYKSWISDHVIVFADLEIN